MSLSFVSRVSFKDVPSADLELNNIFETPTSYMQKESKEN